MMDWIAATVRFAERILGPVVDWLIRLWLAQIFFVSAVLKLSNWDNALELSRNEYPVSWLDPALAAYAGVTIELLGALLLAAGLATRFAAASLLALSLVIQFNYQVLDTNLFWAALFGWYAVRGAGALSLDHVLSRGLADSALPFASRGIALLNSVSTILGPLYQLLLRCWMALSFISAANGLAQWSSLLPIESAKPFIGAAGLTAACLLAFGLATRVVATILFLFSLCMQMMGASEPLTVYWQILFALLALVGPGRLSVDQLADNLLRGKYPQLDGKPAFSLEGLPRVVIVGAGFGGIACASKLARTPVRITLIDRHNYHLFQPLLYQVATTALSPGDIAAPIRGLFREQFNLRTLLGTVTGVNASSKEVLIGEQRVPYDYLVLATGAAHSYFGRDEWAAFAPGLKRVEDATDVRRKILLAFEKAEATTDADERKSLLTFLIVGGGPTGVELAGAIAELARFGMEKEYRSFDPAQARVILVQAGPRVLPTFPERLSAITQRSLENLGVEVITDSRVEKIDDLGVIVSGQRIAARTVLWAAGVVASPAAKWLGVDADKAGRVKVAADLSVPGHGDTFVIGDTALANGWNGGPVPGLAPAAKQGGQFVASVIRARVFGRAAPKEFIYRHLGSLATIGRKAAVADFGFMKVWGALAWWLWGAIHVGFLVGARNRISVMLDWFWAYLTFRSGTRLITGPADEPSAPAAVQVTHPKARSVEA